MQDVDATTLATPSKSNDHISNDHIEVKVHFVWDEDGNVEVHTDSGDAFSNFYDNNSPGGLVWGASMKVKLPRPRPTLSPVTVGIPPPDEVAPEVAGVAKAEQIEE